MAKKATALPAAKATALMAVLKNRFEQHAYRHRGIQWESVAERLQANPDKLASLQEMENTGGEPDVVGVEAKTGAFLFFDCAAESPKGRRSVCYDREAQLSRKEFAPENNAMDMAKAMGVELLTEAEYRYLQQLEPVDAKTSSWLKTPEAIRKLGGAIFGDYRYQQVFVYHNGVQSYYAARGFRACLKV